MMALTFCMIIVATVIAASYIFKEDGTRFLISALILVLLMFGIVTLAGCTAGRYVECIARDATSNPCN